MAKNTATAAADAIAAAMGQLEVTTGGGPGADLPETKFDRLSVERRVLGHVTDEVDFTPLGPRNTLAALTFSLMRDRGTTHPPATHGRLEVEGKSVEEVASDVLGHLDTLVDTGLVSQHADGSYHLTKAGVAELQS